jgi:hypothetical protein
MLAVGGPLPAALIAVTGITQARFAQAVLLDAPIGKILDAGRRSLKMPNFRPAVLDTTE